MEIIISYDIISLGLLLKLVYKPDSKSGAPKAYRFKSDRGHHKDYFTPSKSLEFFLCLARIFLPLSHIGTTPRGCGTKKLKYSCLLCGRRKESPGFFFAGMQRRGPGMKKWRFFEPKELAIKNFSFPFLRLSLLTSNWGSSHIYLTPHQR